MAICSPYANTKVTGIVQCISIFTAYSKYNSLFNHMQITLLNQLDAPSCKPFCGIFFHIYRSFLPTIDRIVIKLILFCCKSDSCKSIRGVVAINHNMVYCNYNVIIGMILSFIYYYIRLSDCTVTLYLCISVGLQ